MQTLFRALTHAVEGAPAVALTAAFVWGVLSVILSPCHLSSIPLIVAFVNGQGRMSTRRALLVSLSFSVGILLTIGAVGALTAVAGRMWGDVGPFGTYVVVGLFLLIGLHLLGVVPLPVSRPGTLPFAKRGVLAAFVVGLVFGVALGPCTFAFLAPMLGVVFKAGSSSLSYSALLLGAYGVGHCAVIAAAGTSTGWVQRYLDWNEGSHGAANLRRACGVLVILAGLYIIYRMP